MSNAPKTVSSALPAPYFESKDARFRLYQGDCLSLLPLMPEESFDVVFADPPYFLSNGGITCQAGKMVSVNKGKWDVSRGFAGNYAFTKDWISACRRVMKPNGTIWISGTSHIIHVVGSVLDELGLKILNDITWVKPNPPPNLSCRYFTHATETVIWAGRDKKTKHKFNYQLMRRLAGGKQMKSVWEIKPPSRDEKVFGKHPTQKPLELLERIIAASSDENDLVLDPFSGSGTTGVAAAKLIRRFSGVDADCAFLDVAVLRYDGVPQADNPERIIELVRLHKHEAPTVGAVSSTLGLTNRQVHYYRQAACLLGLLDHDGHRWAMNETGRRICEESQEEGMRLLARRIMETSIVRSAVKATERFRTTESQKAAVAGMLQLCTALTESTAKRRAQTLLAWIKWAKEMEPGDPLPLYRDVSTASEEPNDSSVSKKL